MRRQGFLDELTKNKIIIKKNQQKQDKTNPSTNYKLKQFRGPNIYNEYMQNI